MDAYRRNKIINKVLVPILAILSGLAVAAVLIIVAGVQPLEAYGELFKAAFGCQALSRCALFTTFERATPLDPHRPVGRHCLSLRYVQHWPGRPVHDWRPCCCLARFCR